MSDVGKAYQELISLAVHELRTPAGVVEGYLRMLQQSSEPFSARQRKMIDDAERSCARVLALVAELNEILKLDAGVAVIVHEPVDFFALVEETADGMRETRLQVTGAPTCPRIRGDVARLKAAVLAIFRALLRESPSGVSLIAERRLVTSTRGEKTAVLLVGDASRVQRAYDEPRAAFNEIRGGSGLALPLARRVIEAHGGRIWSPRGTAGASDEAIVPGGLRGEAVIALPLG